MGVRGDRENDQKFFYWQAGHGRTHTDGNGDRGRNLRLGWEDVQVGHHKGMYPSENAGGWEDRGKAYPGDGNK